MNTKKLSIAVVGSGMIGKCHAQAIAANPRADLRWVCDANPDLADSLAKESGAKACYDYSAVLGDAGLDAVVIATPPWLHHDMALAAVRLGKHVLCEKAMALYPHQAQEMAEAAAESHVVLADCSARHARLNPRFREIRRMIHDGSLGDVYFIKYTSRWRRNRTGIEYHPTAKWYLDKSKSGGGVGINWGIYDLSFLYGLFDDKLDLADVTAFANRKVDDVDPGTPVYDIEEHLGAMLKFKSGLSVMWETSKACHNAPSSRIEVFGTAGGVSASPLNWDPADMVLYDDGPEGLRDTHIKVPEWQKYADNDLFYIDDDFVAAVLDGHAPAMPGASAARILATLDEVYRKANLR